MDASVWVSVCETPSHCISHISVRVCECVKNMRGIQFNIQILFEITARI